MALRTVILLLAAGASASAQVMDGELTVRVLDPSGAAVAGAAVTLVGRNPPFRAERTTDAAGEALVRRVPPGVYRITADAPGFASAERDVEVRSAVPRTIEVRLEVGGVETAVTVEAEPPLLDPLEPTQAMRAGREQLEQTLGTTPGRSVIDVVTTMPGWLLEANAVLHPRGSEYDTQYVVDGMPVYDNRSIAFAPAYETSEFEAVNILTAGIPAEYGRRLGGVISLDTRRAARPGPWTEVDLLAGSYDTYHGSASHQYDAGSTVFSLGLLGGSTDRYLDPPSLQNFTNEATTAGVHGRLLQDVTDRDRLTFYFRTNRTNFLVPNDLVQQAAGQRQDRQSAETAGQVHYQRTFSSRMLGSVRGMVRDLTSRLRSNPLSTPVYVDQDRGFREGAAIADLTYQGERQTIKVGGDVRVNDIREAFQLAAPDELPALDIDFFDSRQSTEVGLFAQDQFRFGNFAANVGLRYDYYRLIIEEHAVSPRVALSYYVPAADLQLRASYDRIFMPPPMENLLLSNAGPTLGLEEVEDAIDLPPTRANFFEVGLRKPLGRLARLDVSHYWRTFRNYIDDDVFLNTGVSFPITFDTARIEGTEVRLEMPRWRGVSAWASWSNLHGIASSPVTGGLFIEGGEAEELREGVEHFPISQDQRNTVAAQIRFEPHRRAWFSVGARYGSGLPIELEDDDEEEEGGEGGGLEDDDTPEQPIPPAILAKVNLDRGRVKPNFSLDLSAGFRVWERDPRSVTVQLDVRNVTDRLNVINFSGLFSGTALAPGRQISGRLKLRF